MKYQNKNNGIIAELIVNEKKTEKFGTVDLVTDDGKMKTISMSTLKRWWKAIPEEETIEQEQEEASKYVEASQQITKELNKNNSKSLEQMVEAQAEKPKKKAKKQTVPAVNVDELVKYVTDKAKELGATLSTRRDSDHDRINIVFSGDKHVRCYIYIQKSSIQMYTKEQYIDGKTLKKMRQTNQQFNCKVKIDAVDDKNKSLVDDILTNINNQINKEAK